MSEVSKSEEIDHSTQHVGPHHPAFGFMKGLLTVAPGVDLTAPICPHWEAYAEKKYGPIVSWANCWHNSLRMMERG
jgi:hypothetical protein